MNGRPPVPTPTSELPTLAPRADDTHKGQVGRVAIIAGSPGMSGAAVLCGLGALRGGAGLVRVRTPASVQPIVAASEPCLMVQPLLDELVNALPGDAYGGAYEAGWADVIAAGPGLGVNRALRVLPAISRADVPLVLDADALSAIAYMPSDDARAIWLARGGRVTVLTPHAGEMERLRRASGMSDLATMDDAARLAAAHEYACFADATVVLKGHRTVVCTAEQAYINTTGNPGMATGGMGDVLTGLIAALLGQGLSAFDAARLAVHAHGLAADRLAKAVAPFGYLAREVADAIPAALADATRPRLGFKSG